MGFVYVRANEPPRYKAVDEERKAVFHPFGGNREFYVYKLLWRDKEIRVNVDEKAEISELDPNKYVLTRHVIGLGIPDLLKPEIGMIMRLIGEAFDVYEFGRRPETKGQTLERVIVEFAPHLWEAVKYWEKRK